MTASVVSATAKESRQLRMAVRASAGNRPAGDAGRIEQLRAGLAQEFGVEVLYHGAVVSQSEDCTRLITKVEERLGRIDILVNNAGIQYLSPIESFPVEQWNAILAVNLSAAFHTIRVALPGMKMRGWGRLINIASVHGLVASVNGASCGIAGGERRSSISSI
jgi:3-hydroxybutyrate dehydrogenase